MSSWREAAGAWLLSLLPHCLLRHPLVAAALSLAEVEVASWRLAAGVAAEVVAAVAVVGSLLAVVAVVVEASGWVEGACCWLPQQQA